MVLIKRQPPEFSECFLSLQVNTVSELKDFIVYSAALRPHYSSQHILFTTGIRLIKHDHRGITSLQTAGTGDSVVPEGTEDTVGSRQHL